MDLIVPSHQMKVVVQESTIVRPAEEIPAIKIWMSSLDLTGPNFHVQPVYFYRPNGAPNFFDTKVMKTALSRALVAFYPLAGRFEQSEDGRISINCRGQGAEFLVAESDGVINDFGDFAPKPDSLKLIPVVDYSLGVESYPLLVVQVTHFKCGGVSLVVGLHHRVADGSSITHFINTWSDITCGLGIALPPSIDRTLLRARDPPQPVFDHVEYHPTPFVKLPFHVPLDNTNTVSSIFKLTRDHLNMLKAKAREDGNTTRYTTFEILSGHIWKCMCRARGLPEDVDTKLYIPTNGRARLHPPLPKGYFRNVLFTTTCIATAGDIQSKPFWYATSKIHDALTMRNNDYLKSALDYLEQHRDQKHEVSYKHANIRIVSWARLAQYQADFGWGRPIFVGPTLTLAGMCIIAPSQINDEGLSIIIGLEVEQMKVFKNLLYAIGSNCRL